MPMTKKERKAEDERAKERLKKRAQRERRRVLGAPSTEAVARAIVEANAFVLAGVNIGRKKGEPRTSVVDLLDVMRTAVVILVRRGHYDVEQVNLAVTGQMSPREEHMWTGHIPSLASPELSPLKSTGR